VHTVSLNAMQPVTKLFKQITDTSVIL